MLWREQGCRSNGCLRGTVGSPSCCFGDGVAGDTDGTLRIVMTAIPRASVARADFLVFGYSPKSFQKQRSGGDQSSIGLFLRCVFANSGIVAAICYKRSFIGIM